MVTATLSLDRAREVTAGVTDPELPMLTLLDLGVLRSVHLEDGVLVVTITPTYSGCPALEIMRDDLRTRLGEAGFDRVEVRIVLQPPWSSDQITEHGRAALLEHGISAPGPAPAHRPGPVPLSLGPVHRSVSCPRCDSATTLLVSEFGSTSCKALYRCADCGEPFDHVKEI